MMLPGVRGDQKLNFTNVIVEGTLFLLISCKGLTSDLPFLTATIKSFKLLVSYK